MVKVGPITARRSAVRFTLSPLKKKKDLWTDSSRGGRPWPRCPWARHRTPMLPTAPVYGICLHECHPVQPGWVKCKGVNFMWLHDNKVIFRDAPIRFLQLRYDIWGLVSADTDPIQKNIMGTNGEFHCVEKTGIILLCKATSDLT